MRIDAYTIDTSIALAPMADIIDKPLRRLYRTFGADWAVDGILHSGPASRNTAKTLHRSNFGGEEGVAAVQIAGSDPRRMAEAAIYNVVLGAQLIGVNIGCPAKKVCSVQVGNALMQNEPLVAAILEAVVGTAGAPVTLKTRLGWHNDHRSILIIACIAEESGIATIAIRGRTRTRMYRGEASYELVARARGRLNIPVRVNGGITSPQKVATILWQTGADDVMIERGTRGRLWLFRDLAHYTRHDMLPEALSLREYGETMLAYVRAMHDFYSATAGTRIACKHVGWYLDPIPEGEAARRGVNHLDDAAAQYDAVAAYLSRLSGLTDAWACDCR